MEIVGHNALVTGAGRRVGKAIALALAAEGANIFVHYGRSAAFAQEVAAEIEAGGTKAAYGSANLSDPSTASDLIARATEALGPISILVNSASGFPDDRLESVTLDQLRSAHDLTLASPVFLTQAMAAALPDNSEGAVVNVTDVKTLTPYREHFSYMLAKGALDTFTRAAALALAPRIRVNAVALGAILPPPGEPESYLERQAALLPLQRVGGTGPVGEAVVHLVSNSFVTGEIVRLDGGAHLT